MSEFKIQCDLISFFRDNWPQHERSIRVSLNGLNFGSGKRAAMMINQIKSQGAVLGEADLFFAVKRGNYGGLFIELKADKDSKIDDDQLSYLEYMRGMGYKACLCVGEEAWQVLTEYMEGE